MSSRKSTLSSSSFRYSSGSLNRSAGSTTGQPRDQIAKKLAKKTCMCSPTTHPGSFRCSLHKNMMMTSNSPTRLNIRRSAMANSLVRMATNSLGEGGDRVKRALAALIRPSSHHQRRMSVFEPKPSRLSIMSNANDDDDDGL